MVMRFFREQKPHCTVFITAQILFYATICLLSIRAAHCFWINPAFVTN